MAKQLIKNHYHVYKGKKLNKIIHPVFNLKKNEDLEEAKNDKSFSINALNEQRQNALFSCSFKKFSWLVENNINIHHTDIFNRNALFYSLSMNKFHLLKEKNIDICLIDYRQESFLFEFIQYGNKKNAKHAMNIIKNNIEELRPIINHVNFENLNILHLFCSKEEIQYEDLKYLCDQGVEYHHLDNNGYNILVHCLDNEPMAFKFFLDYDKENKIPFPVKYDHNLLMLLDITFHDKPEKYKEYIELLYNAKKNDFYNLYYEFLTFENNHIKNAKNICSEFVSLKEKEELQIFSKQKNSLFNVKRI